MHLKLQTSIRSLTSVPEIESFGFPCFSSNWRLMRVKSADERLTELQLKLETWHSLAFPRLGVLKSSHHWYDDDDDVDGDDDDDNNHDDDARSRYDDNLLTIKAVLLHLMLLPMLQLLMMLTILMLVLMYDAKYRARQLLESTRPQAWPSSVGDTLKLIA